MKKINETFMCIQCWREVSLAKKTCRNHCPFCFTSLHVDEKLPWDRASNCRGKMVPIAYEIKNADYKILFRCEKCGKEHWNKRADDDEITLLPEVLKNASG